MFEQHGRNIEAVIHTIGVMGELVQLNPRYHVRLNVVGLINVLELARVSQVPRVLYTTPAVARSMAWRLAPPPNRYRSYLPICTPRPRSRRNISVCTMRRHSASIFAWPGFTLCTAPGSILLDLSGFTSWPLVSWKVWTGCMRTEGATRDSISPMSKTRPAVSCSY
jgi:hypothetical protein